MTSPFCHDEPLVRKRPVSFSQRAPEAVAVRRKYVLNVRFRAAQVRLLNFVSAGALAPASSGAYAAGLSVLAEPRAFHSRLPAAAAVKVQAMEPIATDGVVILPLRWEASGQAIQPLPVLDADLSLIAAPGGTTLLVLNGTFRLPEGRAAPFPGLAARPQVAAVACADSLLAHVAGALTGPIAPPHD
jgi:hypothetical protein